jgi:hypothetical protein
MAGGAAGAVSSHRNVLCASTADSSPATELVDRSADLVGDSVLYAGAADRAEGRHAVKKLCDVGAGTRRLIFEKLDRASAVIRIATVIAIDEERSDFMQIVRSNRPFAHHARGSRERRPAIYQDESHVAPPSAKQNTVSDEWKALGRGALPSGLSLFRSTFSGGNGNVLAVLPALCVDAAVDALNFSRIAVRIVATANGRIIGHVPC